MEQGVPQTDAIIHKYKQVRLLILVTLLFLTFVIAYAVITKQRKEQQEQLQSFLTPKVQQSNVSLKKEYKNPFDTNVQYVNPFSQYKNPFDSLK